MKIFFVSKTLTTKVTKKARRTQRKDKTLQCFVVIFAASSLLISCSSQGTYNKFIRNAGEGNLTIVTTLFERGHVPHVNVQDSLGNTALMMAAKNGHGEIVRYLLSRGADPLLTNRNGDTAFTLASKAGHAEIASFLRPKPVVL